MYLYPTSKTYDLHNELDRVLENFWGPPARAAREDVWHPSTEIEEASGHFLLTVDLPGMKRSDLKIELLRDQLVISGERKQEDKKGGYSERLYGKFRRVFSLPQGVDGSKVEAQYEDGVLRVLVPKAEVVQPRQVTVSAGGGTFAALAAKKSDDGQVA